MIFIETPIFTTLVLKLLPDEDYQRLQQVLALRPEAGSLIPGSGGLRKIRWRLSGQGKRGGLRIIYYWETADHQIYLLLIYRKTEQEDLTSGQLKILRSFVQEWLHEKDRL